MMKLLGATMVVLACTGAGFIAASYANIEAVTLKQYILALDYMICDLEYSHAPLPELFTKASDRCNSILKKVFYQLAVNLESQIYPSVRECFENTIGSFTYIPRMTLAGLYQLGDTVGALDLHGQISSMQAVRSECEMQQKQYLQNHNTRLRNYKTMGICIGVAIVILFI